MYPLVRTHRTCHIKPNGMSITTAHVTITMIISVNIMRSSLEGILSYWELDFLTLLCGEIRVS